MFLVSVSSNQVDENEVGSGDEEKPDWRPNPGTGWHDRGDDRYPGTGTGWHDKHDSRWGYEDDDYNEGGSGDEDTDHKHRVPDVGVEPPPREDVGGAGIVIDDNDDTLCEEAGRYNHCHNGGTCYITHVGITYCVCSPNFEGGNCETVKEVIVKEDEIVGKTQEEPTKQRKFTLRDILLHPAFIAVAVGACLLFLALVISLLVFCCRCIQKKDEGSYALDSAMLGGQKVEYTKVDNYSQEIYA